MFKMLNNYEKRVKNFVLKMAVHPVVIKKNKKIEPTSHEPLQTSENNIIKKNFSFKNYIPEKERINIIMERKASLDKYLEKMEKSKRKQEIINKKKNEPKLVQPSMRFSSRTNLEKVYDIIKNKNFFYSQQKSLKSQLAKLGFKSHSIENNNLEEYEIEGEKEAEKKDDKENNKIDYESYYNNIINNTENLSEEQMYKRNLHNRILKERINMKNNLRLLMEIEKNKKLEKKYENNTKDNLYQKTHFKATENLKMFKTTTVNHNSFKDLKKEREEKQHNLKINQFYETMGPNFPKLLKIKTNNINNKYGKKKNVKKIVFKKIGSLDEFNGDNYISANDELRKLYANSFNTNKYMYEDINNINNIDFKRNNSYNHKRQYNINKNKNILNELNITKDIASCNPLLYNLNFMQSKNENDKFISNKEHLNLLKKIAFEKYEGIEDTFYQGDSHRKEFEDLKKEENIVIDGKEFKKSDIDKIAGKVLTKCNWNENDVNYKPNDGGLMFTNGLTIKEFEEKYGL